MASQSSTHGSSSTYQQNVAAETTRFYSSAKSFNEVLSKVAAGKGLAFYNPNNKIEVLLKNVVNANKDALTSVSTIISNIPVLGPVLGPSMFPPASYGSFFTNDLLKQLCTT
jgi:hypothetical protein